MTTKPYTYYLGRDPEGRHAVFSTQEPIFCYVCDSEEEALRKADETFRSFISTFAPRGNMMPGTRTSSVPVHRVTPSRAFNKDLALA